MKSWIRSRTMWVAFGVGLLGLLQTTLETAPIPEAYAGIVTMVIGATIATLRAVTKTAIGSSKK